MPRTSTQHRDHRTMNAYEARRSTPPPSTLYTPPEYLREITAVSPLLWTVGASQPKLTSHESDNTGAWHAQSDQLHELHEQRTT